MIELGLAVGASVAWGASDFVAGRSARERSVLLVLCGTQFVGLLLVSVAVIAAGEPMPGTAAIAYAAAAGVCEVSAFAALYAALASGPMGPVAPVAALGGVVPLGFHLAGGGALSASAAAGVAAALVGVALVSVEGEGGVRVSRKAVALAAASAVGFGLFFVLLGQSSEAGEPLWSVGITRVVAVLVTATLALAVAGHRRRGSRGVADPARFGGAPPNDTSVDSAASRLEVAGFDVGTGDAPAFPRTARPAPDLWWLAAAGALDIAANALFALAVSRSTDVSLSIIGSLYPVTTVVLARLVLREEMSRLQHAGAVLTLAGVLLVGGV